VAKLSDLPSWLKPFAADELKEEERRQKLIERRKKRFDGIVARYEQIGDLLIEFNDIAQNLTATIPGITSAMVAQRLVSSAKLGAFPTPRTGFGREPNRSAVRGLVDLYSLYAEPPFPPGQYPLRPSLLTIEAAPLAMRARRSILIQWLRSQGWPVRSLQSGRGNAAYDDAALVARAWKIYPTLPRPSKRRAARAVVDEIREQSPATIKAGDQQAWINRIRKKM
jgi:hypothetical protein